MRELKSARLSLVLGFIALFSLTAPATSAVRANNSLSAIRNPGEDYQAAYLRFQFNSWDRLLSRRSLLEQRPTDSVKATPWGTQGPYEQLSLGRIPELASLTALGEMFERVRDLRGWRWNNQPDFARRIPWLYGDDGCYLRAEMSVQKFREWGYRVPFQILVFGNLNAVTYYGHTSWWFHVAPIVRVGGAAYVLDPSLDSSAPLTLENWVLKMVPEKSAAMYAICRSHTINPEGDCEAEDSDWDEYDKVGELQKFLGLEWQTLEKYLGRAPEDILGDSPPWQKNSTGRR